MGDITNISDAEMERDGAEAEKLERHEAAVSRILEVNARHKARERAAYYDELLKQGLDKELAFRAAFEAKDI